MRSSSSRVIRRIGSSCAGYDWAQRLLQQLTLQTRTAQLALPRSAAALWNEILNILFRPDFRISVLQTTGTIDIHHSCDAKKSSCSMDLPEIAHLVVVVDPHLAHACMCRSDLHHGRKGVAVHEGRVRGSVMLGHHRKSVAKSPVHSVQITLHHWPFAFVGVKTMRHRMATHKRRDEDVGDD